MIGIRTVKLLLRKLIPHVHNLPQIIYINWLGFEWFIEKTNGRRKL